jgi:hypothetical protein
MLSRLLSIKAHLEDVESSFSLRQLSAESIVDEAFSP